MFEHRDRFRWRRRWRAGLGLLAAGALLIGAAACADEESPSSADREPGPAVSEQAERQAAASETRTAQRSEREAVAAAQQDSEEQAAEPAPAAQEQTADYQSQQQAQSAAAPARSGVQQAEAQEDAMEAEEAEEESAAYEPSSSSSSSSSSQQRRQPPSDTTFRDYERSELVRTAEDDTATFSLDVDRTSYRLALNWAQEGLPIDPDSVRAEEWINAFDYRYERPSSERFFAITSDWMVHPLQNERHMVRLAFQAPELEDDRPLNVTLVLDASGSMADGNRVAIARAAAESIRRGLREQDRIAVVQFTDSVVWELVVEPTRPGDRGVRRSIEELYPRNSTNVQAGLNLGVEFADEMRRERPDAYNYVILMSDGVANVDATDPFAILNRVGDGDDRNPLRLITVGVGIENYNDYLLEQLAQHGNGWYRYLSTPAEAQAVFSRENWLALSRPFADATRAQVVWDPNVVGEWRMIGYENRVTSDASFDQDRREFAEIPVGAATTVFFEVGLTRPLRGEPLRLGSVELRWLNPLDGEARSQLHEVLVNDGGSWSDEQLALFDLGALVALSSDRYSRLSELVGSDAALVRRELDAAAEMLERSWYADQLGGLDAYRDFRFLLDHLRDALPLDARSGYSR